MNTGWSGSVNDAKLFIYSALYKKANSKQLLPNAIRQITAINVPVFVMGDSAYPLLSLVMKSFTQPNVDTDQRRTDKYRICRGGVVGEIAFKVYKGEMV